MLKTVILEAPFNKNPDWAAIIDRRRHFTKPVVIIRIPAAHLPG
jgi:hypothetical protein